MVTSWHDYPAGLLGYTERSLLAWFEQNVRRTETWIDVGAHYGYTALALCRLVGPSGHIYAFEPVLSTAAHLAATRRLNGLDQLHVVPLGLSDTGNISPVEAGLVRGMAEHRRLDHHVTDTIHVVALDQVWDGLAAGKREVHGVKIDIQGMELKALKGMQAILRSARPKLAIEFHPGVDRSDLLSLLQNCGYDPVGRPIAPPSTEREPSYADDRTYIFTPRAKIVES